jgi:acylphosphatase
VAVVTERRVFALVIGDVQGVGFRWFARDAAQQNRIGGWICNRADGNVELVASGSSAGLEAFLAKIRRGPARSHVRELQIRDETSDEILPFPFEIRR